MSDAAYLTFWEFLVALLMSLAALSAFVWAVASGAFRNVEAIKHRVLRLEEEQEEREKEHARREP